MDVAPHMSFPLICTESNLFVTRDPSEILNVSLDLSVSIDMVLQEFPQLCSVHILRTGGSLWTCLIADWNSPSLSSVFLREVFFDRYYFWLTLITLIRIFHCPDSYFTRMIRPALFGGPRDDLQ